jgi:hypothetical protein
MISSTRRWTTTEPIQVIYSVDGIRTEKTREAISSPLDVLINALAESGWIEQPASGCVVFVREEPGRREELTLVAARSASD